VKFGRPAGALANDGAVGREGHGTRRPPPGRQRSRHPASASWQEIP